MKTKLKTIALVSHKDVLEKITKKYGEPGYYANQILSKVTFTEGTKYEVAIIKGTDMKEGFTTQDVRDKALELGYTTPPPEIALLLREKLSDEEIQKMGLSWIITLHKPILDSDGRLSVLSWDVGDYDCVGAYDGHADDRWFRDDGFAFVVSQVGTQNSDTKNFSEALPLELEINGIMYIKKL